MRSSIATEAAILHFSFSRQNTFDTIGCDTIGNYGKIGFLKKACWRQSKRPSKKLLCKECLLQLKSGYILLFVLVIESFYLVQ